VGVNPNQDLFQLQKEVSQQLESIGIEPDEKSFKPHITLARFKFPPTKQTLQQFQTEHENVSLEPIYMDEFKLFSSQLASQGAIYTIEQTYVLHEYKSYE
jgi:2'-5' RNA ligase